MEKPKLEHYMRLVAMVSILNVIALIYGVTEGNWFAVYAGSLLYHYSQNLTIEDRVRSERRLFHGLFATEDQKEGMHAFIEKRAPQFTGH